MGSHVSVTTSPPPAAAEQPEKQSLSQYKNNSHPVVDLALRVFLFITSLVAIIVMLISKQTKLIQVTPNHAVLLTGKFSYIPSFIYLITALSVVCLYSIVTGALSVLALMKPGGISTKLQFHFVMFDALLLGIMASATGAASGVSYTGIKGNSHTGWNKMCTTYDSFCFRAAASILLSLISSITILLLVLFSTHMLYKKTTRR
ncbi:unnamed protein product [Lactuca saligna]|uniref:CASP-like protein n=1 Tax=Lactuca saligna TaxID=75948 RepID=A0AA36E835_LACSI|nr:unnamed protein product [Lactuca saligna]